MIELTLTVRDVDYDALIARFGGSLGGVAAMAAKALPQSAKEEMAVKYLNSNVGKLSQKLEGMARQNGVGVTVASARAKVV